MAAYHHHLSTELSSLAAKQSLISQKQSRNCYELADWQAAY